MAHVIGGLFSLGLSVVAVVVMSVMLGGDMAVLQLVRVQDDSQRAASDLIRLQSSENSTAACIAAFQSANATYNNCTDAGLAACNELSARYASAQTNLTTMTVASLQTRLDAVLASCQSRTDALKLLIAQVAGAPNSTTLQNGTLSAVLQGHTPVETTYELRQLILGGDFRYIYLRVAPWQVEVAANMTDPTLTFGAFAPSVGLGNSQGTRLLLEFQQSVFNKPFGLVETIVNSIILHGQGDFTAGETLVQAQDFTIN